MQKLIIMSNWLHSTKNIILHHGIIKSKIKEKEVRIIVNGEKDIIQGIMICKKKYNLNFMIVWKKVFQMTMLDIKNTNV